MIGIYLRLSKADQNGTSTQEGSSASIQAQRLAAEAYLARCPELAGVAQAAYIDDGSSGVTTKRPQLQELLAHCEQGRVSCVVVNDLSRLSRSYLDAGILIEQVLPALGVRFISVQDGIDTKDDLSIDPETSFLLGFRNIVNAHYSHEVSRKVKQGLRAQWKAGTHVQAQVPYGYRYDKQARGRLAVDEAAARYVRLVFALAKEGFGTGDIADILNARGVPTPAEHAFMLKHGRGIPRTQKWTRDKVRNILKREEYTGVLVGGKTACAGLGPASPRRRTAPDAQIRVEGAHVALVSREDFEEAQGCLAWRGRRESSN